MLIQQQSDGSAKVIGGGAAGAALAHLRLTGIKPESSYKEALAQRAKDRRERAKAQRERDKEAGLSTAKAEAHARVTEQTHEAQKSFISDVAKAMGWAAEETKFTPPQDAEDKDLARLRAEHHKGLLTRAREAVDLNRQRLLNDADARSEAEFGDIPLNTEDPDVLSVQDVDPVASSTGLGFSTDYKKRAEAKGSGPDDIRAEASEVTGKVRKPAGVAKKIGEEAEGLREALGPDTLSPKLVDAKKALELIKLDKKRRMAERQAKDAHKKIADAVTEPKAAVVEVDDAKLDKAVAEEMANDLRTISTRAFLSEVGKTAADPVKALGRHVGAGAYNSVNALALAAGGAALVDRSVVDVLGVAGAAEVLARRLQADLSPEELADVTAGMEDFHLNHYLAATSEALDRARELKAHAEEISLGSAETGADLAALQEANRLRGEAVDEAARIMGQTLGETEANAALVYALKRGKSDKPFEVALGDLNVESAIRQLRAIGLQRGDYQIETIGGNRVATITPEGMGRLASPVQKADLEQVRRNLDIISGGQDEDGWLPDGFSDRPDLAMDLKPGVAPTLAEPFRPGENLEQSIRDYIGGRAADGDAPADIVSDLQSAAFFQKVGGRTSEYRGLLDKLAPLQDGDGKLRPTEALRSDFEAMADAYVQARGGTVSPLHRQSFPVDDKAMDAVHRALSEEPAGVAAYKPVGELTPQDQGSLRDWFAKHVAKESPETGSLRAELEGMAEPERETTDMFGDKAVNPDWSAWKSRRDELASKLDAASLTWPKYVESMRSPQAAYAAVQDLVQSRVGKSFADAYNTLKPDVPLKLGRGSVRGALNHLDAVDPKARDARVAKERAMVDRLRERAGGKYASGSVRDKLDAAREEDAGLQAAQMGFFADDEEDREARPLAPDERHSLGHAAEQQLAKLVPHVGQNFKPGQPVKLFRPTMSGGKNWARQRAIKMLAANKRVALSFGTGSGKAQPLTAKVLTPTGWRPMGSLVVGDKVIAGDGSVTSVTGVFPQGEKDIYRVVMDDGSATECCDDHLWLTSTRTERKRAIFSARQRKGVAYWGGAPKPEQSVRPLSEIRATLHHLGVRNHQIPLVPVVEFATEWRSSLDPYLLGVLIGDGCLAGGCVRVSSVDHELLQEVSSLLPSGLKLRPDTGCDYRITTGRRGGAVKAHNLVLEEIRRLGLYGKRSADKCIPPDLLVTSSKARIALLQGLMDTDGSASRSTGSAIFYTVSAQLASDVTALVNSLGGICRRSLKRAPTYAHNGERRHGADCHILHLSLPAWVTPFRLARKANVYKAPTKYAPRHRIISEILPVGRAQAQCIAVSHPSHLYVTDDFIVTHNTAIGLGAFSHLHAAGKVKKGLFLVPSIAQGGFGADALRFLEPGKYKWHAQPGASREERLAAYKDPETHFSVVTHQAFRDDMLHLGAEKEGVSPEEMATRIQSMSRSERKVWMSEVMARHGIGVDYLNIDEGHGILNRQGKDNSRMADVIDAAGDASSYYVNATADPVKNDVSEAFSLLQKMDPERYTDRAAFMRRYGVDTQSAKDELRREMARFQYPSKIDPDVTATRSEQNVPVSPEQHAKLAELDRTFAKVRMARMQGGVDVDAVKRISPTAFENAPEDQHEAIARELSKSLGIMKASAMRKVLDADPAGGKVDAVSKLAAARPGRPGVVFAHSLDSVEAVRKRLADQGLRVTTITGKHTAEEKAAAIRAINPDRGERTADIVVASDAGATGANLQAANWLVNYDTPDTAAVHAQRNGRINRTGQTSDVELIDLVSDHPSERRARARLREKYALRDLMTTPMEGLDDSGLAYFLKQRRVQREQGGAA